MSQLFNLLWRAVFGGEDTSLPHPNVDLTSCTVIVTGANSGLGKDIAAKVAALNASKTIIAVRSVSKGEAARSEIIKLNPNLDPSSIDVWSLDMADFSSIKSFVQRATSELPRLDVAVLNAGIVSSRFETTKDGWESALQVNGLGTFYLALLLLPLLQKTSKEHYASPGPPSSLAKPHLSIVSSDRHAAALLSAREKPEIYKALNVPDDFNPADRYDDTKLLEILFVRELANHLETSNPGEVIVNSSNPGFCHSNLSDNGFKESAYDRWKFTFFKVLFARPTEVGARALTWAAVSSSETGAYSEDCRDQKPSPWAQSDEGVSVGERVWKETIDILGRLDSSIPSVIA